MGRAFGKSLGDLVRRLFRAAFAIPLAAFLVWSSAGSTATKQKGK